MQRADKRKYHYIYKITRFDGKYYIGMHSTDNLEDGYFGSGKLISRSIKKYGLEKHTKEILEFLSSRLALGQREKQIVNEDIILDPLCMNLKLGGSGGMSSLTAHEMWSNSHSRQNIIAGLKQSANTDEAKLRYSKEWKDRWQDNSFKECMRAARIIAWENAEYREKQKSASLKRYEEMHKVHKEQIQKIIDTDQVDFSKFGWVGEISRRIGVKSHIQKLFEKLFPDFYHEKCFKRKPRIERLI